MRLGSRHGADGAHARTYVEAGHPVTDTSLRWWEWCAVAAAFVASLPGTFMVALWWVAG